MVAHEHWMSHDATCAGCDMAIPAGQPRISQWGAWLDGDPPPDMPMQSWHGWDCVAAYQQRQTKA